MEFHKDFAELCSSLNANTVEYLIVGGYAVAFHGAPRFTGDLDVLVRPEASHLTRMLAAVSGFGFPAHDIEPEYILSQKKILQLGRIPVQIHIMTSITGVTWEDAWATRETGSYGGVPIFYIGKSALIVNKKAAGRDKDRADVRALQKL
jgi:hypothetical protein